MEDRISKTRPILLTVDQGKTHESYFEGLRSDNVNIKIVPATLDEPMEIIIREVYVQATTEARTGTYIPPAKEKVKTEKPKGHIFNRLIDKAV
jgi:hypothetical protein